MRASIGPTGRHGPDEEEDGKGKPASAFPTRRPAAASKKSIHFVAEEEHEEEEAARVSLCG